jgi:hypothetical protein
MEPSQGFGQSYKPFSRQKLGAQSLHRKPLGPTRVIVPQLTIGVISPAVDLSPVCETTVVVPATSQGHEKGPVREVSKMNSVRDKGKKRRSRLGVSDLILGVVPPAVGFALIA